MKSLILLALVVVAAGCVSSEASADLIAEEHNRRGWGGSGSGAWGGSSYGHGGSHGSHRGGYQSHRGRRDVDLVAEASESSDDLTTAEHNRHRWSGYGGGYGGYGGGYGGYGGGYGSGYGSNHGGHHGGYGHYRGRRDVDLVAEASETYADDLTGAEHHRHRWIGGGGYGGYRGVYGGYGGVYGGVYGGGYGGHGGYGGYGGHRRW